MPIRVLFSVLLVMALAGVFCGGILLGQGALVPGLALGGLGVIIVSVISALYIDTMQYLVNYNKESN